MVTFSSISVSAETTESALDDLLMTEVPENESENDAWGPNDGMYFCHPQYLVSFFFFITYITSGYKIYWL